METKIYTEVAVLQSVVYKIDNTVAEIAKASAEVTRLLAVHDSRINSLESGNRDTVSDVKEIYKKMSEDTKEIILKISEMEDRIETKLKDHTEDSSSALKTISARLNVLERWSWTVIGASIGFGFLLNHLDVFK
jgi:hypothetical protein